MQESGTFAFGGADDSGVRDNAVLKARLRPETDEIHSSPVGELPKGEAIRGFKNSFNGGEATPPTPATPDEDALGSRSDTPDLPLGPGAGSPKIGLGLWNHRAAAIAAELAVLFAGGLIYLRATRPRSRGAGVATVADPPSGRAFAVQALIFYAVLAFAAGAVDRRREAQV